jgi:uncharacterized protein
MTHGVEEWRTLAMEAQARAAQSKEPVTRSVSAPFIHKLNTADNRYVFDVNTGDIVKVDDVVWEIIEDFHLGVGPLISRYTPRYTPDQIAAAYGEIHNAREENGLFLDHHPEVGVRPDRERVRHLLDCERQQLILNVTERCNFRCTYCPYTLPDTGIRPHSERNMSWEIARAATDEFLQHCKVIPESTSHPAGPREPPAPEPVPTERDSAEADYPPAISFYGGEPLLNFPLIKRCTEYVIQNSKGRKVSFVVSTNGYLLKGEVAEFLAAHNFSVRVSMDGPAAIHDAHRRTASGSPTWMPVADNFKAFFRTHPDYLPFLGATVARTTNLCDVLRYLATADWIPPTTIMNVFLASDPYPGYYEPIADAARRPGVDESYGKFLANLIKGRFNLNLQDRELMLQRGMFEAAFKQLHRSRWGCAAHRRLPASLTPGGTCVAGHRKTYVSVTGEYYPCERVDEYGTCRIGSVVTGIDEEKVYALLQEFIECTREQCEHCWCVPICSVGCYATVRDRGGFTVAAKQRACKSVQHQLHKGLVDYCTVLEQNPHAFDYMRERVTH